MNQLTGQPEFHRLHPLTMIVEVARGLRGLAGVFVIFIIYRIQGEGMDSMEIVYAFFGFAALAPALVRYFTYSFAIHNGQLLIKQGVFTKQHRTIPLDRIQNINTHRGVIHRMLGLVDLRIETAAGGNSEAALSALSEDQAKLVRAQLLAQSGTADVVAAAPGEVPAPERARATFTASTRELTIAGATQNKALAIIAALASLMYLMPKGEEEALNGVFDFFRNSPAPAMIALLVGGMLLVGWIFSIITTLVTYYGFELAFLGSRMRRSYGLLTQVENVVPLRRVQLMRTTETALQRMLGFCKVYVETAGGFSAQQSQEKQQVTGSSLISPLLEVGRFGELSTLVLPDAESNLGAIEWQQVSPKTIYRQMRSMLFFSLFAAAGSWYWLHWWSLALIPGLLGLGALSGWLRYKTSGWSDAEQVFCSRTGVLGRLAYYAPVSKIQSVSLSQTPVQRRFGVATLTFRTAATSGAAAVEVLDLPSETAERLASSLHQRSAEESWKNPDGF